MPYSVGPVHMEIDKAGAQNVPSFDCCFHPTAVELGAKSKQFRDLLVQTSMDGIEASYKRQKLDTLLERKDYRVLKGMRPRLYDVCVRALSGHLCRRVV